MGFGIKKSMSVISSVKHRTLYRRCIFPAGPTERTKRIWDICLKALEEERNNNGVRSLDNTTVSTITSHKAGYIDKDNELIVGLQTDELLKRSIKPSEASTW